MIYEGRKREGKAGPRLEGIKFEEGAGGNRGRRECEEAIATRPMGAKNKVRASAASESARAMDRSGVPDGSRMAGKTKILPSADKNPSGRPPKMSRAACQGAPTRSACRKVHTGAG